MDREASGSEMGPNQAWAGQPRPAGLACSGPGLRPPFNLGARLFIASASTDRHIHPIIREPPTRKRSIGREPTAAASP
jgi:hypothetical protein